MKRYSILIHGLGPCGEGNSESADMVLQKMLEQLRTSGHDLKSVSIVIDGSAVPIIGALQPHPAADAPASSDAVSLTTISRQLTEIDQKLTLAMAGPPEVPQQPETPVPAPKPRASRKAAEKKEEGPPVVIEELAPVALLGSGGRVAVPGSTGAADGGSQEPPPVRDVGADGICTRCGNMFDEENEADDHINGPMCELKND